MKQAEAQESVQEEVMNDDVDGEPMEAEDVDGEPIENEDLDGEPMEEFEDMDGEPMEEDERPALESKSEPPPEVVNPDAAQVPQPRRRPRAVDMFADSDEEET